MKARVVLSGQTIVIGVGAPLSGMPAALGREMRQAVQIAVDELNQEGGIFGADVRLAVSDDAGDVRKGEEAARLMCEDRQLLAVVGHYNSDVTLAASIIYDNNHVTMITPIVSNPALTERHLANVFRFTNRDDETGLAIARYLRSEKDKQRALIIGTTTTYGKSMSTAFQTSFEALGGTIADQIWIEEGSNEFAELVDQSAGNWDVVFYGGTFEGAPLLKAFRAARKNGLFAAGDGCWDRINFLEPAGSATTTGEGVLILSATPEMGRVGGSRAFSERYGKRYGQIGNYAVNSYDTTKLLLEAIKAAAIETNNLPPRELIARTLRANPFQGIAYREPVRWNAEGDNVSATTALYTAPNAGFTQVAEIRRSDAR